MRFREMHQHLEAYKALRTNNVLGRRFTLRDALERLAMVPALRADATAALQMPIATGTAPFPTSTAVFEQKLERLRQKAELLYEAIAGTLQDENANSIAVRIPSPNDLGQLKDIIHELQQVFEHPVQAALGAGAGEVRLQGFDVGSEWFYIAYAAGAAPLMFIGHILKVANWWRDQTLEAERKRIQLDVDEIAVEALRTHAQVEKQLLESALTRHVRSVMSEDGNAPSGRSSDQEIQRRITNGVQVWAGLLGRGAVAVPALNAASEVREAFPAHPSLEPPPGTSPKLLQAPRTSDARESSENLSTPPNATPEDDAPPQDEK